MKLTFLLPVVLAALAVSGCKHTKSAAPAAASSAASTASTAASSGTAALLDAFKTADASTLQLVQNAASAIGSSDWSAAASALQKIQKIPGLTAPQELAVKNALASVSSKTR